MEKNQQGTTDSEWDNIFSGDQKSKNKYKKKKNKKKRRTVLGQSTEKMASIYKNVGDLVNNS